MGAAIFKYADLIPNPLDKNIGSLIAIFIKNIQPTVWWQVAYFYQ